MGRRVAWIGVALGAAYLIFIGGGWWGIYTSSIRLLTILIAAVTLGAWLVVAIRNQAWRPRTLMWPAIVACLGSLALSTAFSRQPRVSLEYLAYAVVLAALYLLLVRLFADPFFRPRLVATFVMLFGATAALYIASVLNDWISWWQLVGISIPPLRPRFEGLTFGNPSAALTMVALLAVPVAATQGTPSRRGVVVLTVVALVVATVAVMSGSRAGWFALGVTFVVGVATIAAAPALRRPAVEGIRSLIRGQPVVLWLPVVILLVEAVLAAPAIVQRVFAGGETARLNFATAAIRMFASSPIVGTGPGTYVIQRPGTLIQGEPDEYGPHAHNVEVQTLAELGLVGALAGVILLAGVLRLLRIGARSRDPIQRRWSWFGAAGLGYFFLHQLLDFYPNMPAFLFAAAVPIAFLDAHAPRARGSVVRQARRLPRALKQLGMSAAVAFVAICVIGLSAQEFPSLRHDTAVAYADAGNWQAAADPARAAAVMDPTIAPYQYTAGLVASAIGDHAGAAVYFERVVAQIDLPEAWLNLAAEQFVLGDRSASAVSIARSMRLGQQRPSIAMAAGDLALRIGDQAAAVDAFAAAVSVRPSLAGDPWWSADPTRVDLYPNVIARAVAQNETSAWEIELMAGQTVHSTSPLDREIAAAWRGDAPAVDALVKDCAESPLDGVLVSWCARVLRHLGDVRRGSNFTERSEIIGLSSAEGTLESRVQQDGAPGLAFAPLPWATYTYRRSAPRDALVGSLVHLQLE